MLWMVGGFWRILEDFGTGMRTIYGQLGLGKFRPDRWIRSRSPGGTSTNLEKEGQESDRHQLHVPLSVLNSA